MKKVVIALAAVASLGTAAVASVADAQPMRHGWHHGWHHGWRGGRGHRVCFHRYHRLVCTYR